jgi:uncharacterized membrane protein YbaN (DUF454 family)
MGRSLIVLGLLLVALGMVFSLFPHALSWFGHLPGDLRFERRGLVIHAPITSCLLLSVAISLALYLVNRLS